jgi:excisionase family DNA binding protein
MFDKLLKPTEVAHILGVSRSFAYQLIRSGEIVSLRMGKTVRVRPVDLETYVAGNLTGKSVEVPSKQARK